MINKKLLLLITVLFLSACTIYGSYTAQPVFQKYAILETKGMTIAQTDGNWYMQYGKPAATPPKVLASPSLVVTRQHDSGIERMEGGGPMVYELALGREALLARPGYGDHVLNVTLHFDDKSKTLYGQILFIAARTDMPRSKATTFWSIQLPEDVIGKARADQEAMIYQSSYINSFFGNKAEAVTMVMWLSAVPF